MSFREYLKSHYVEACKLQREIILDTQMIEMLHTRVRDAQLVKSWMEGYNLFQGITAHDRGAIVTRFLAFAHSHRKSRRVSDEETIKDFFIELLTALYQEVPRTWMSATSKLLWCLYPTEIAMYDKFVHGTLGVMQCIDSDLSGFPRIGAAPTIKKESDISAATAHYMNYQAMVRKVLSVHADALADLRRRNSEAYPYDIRIVDKLLWMIGNPKTA